jgi:hypothetical protein
MVNRATPTPLVESPNDPALSRDELRIEASIANHRR